jgi:hypothetical protein
MAWKVLAGLLRGLVVGGAPPGPPAKTRSTPFQRSMNMRTRALSKIILVFLLGASGLMASTVQIDHHSSKKDAAPATIQSPKDLKRDLMLMALEPHHVLAMAYHQNLAAFALALHGQAAMATTLDLEISRLAVAEMRRSFDAMEKHHQEHMLTMSAEMHTRMSGRMKQLDMHQAELNSQLTALEQEVKLAKPDPKTVSILSADICAHLEAMSTLHQSDRGNGVKTKVM